MKKKFCLTLLAVFFTCPIAAKELSAVVYSTHSNPIKYGEVVFKDTEFGLLIEPHLTHLPSGLHGFHLHQHPNCDHHGESAGAHFDPHNTNSHQGPFGKGHLGDLPVLYVDNNGVANIPTLAPRLKTGNLRGLAVMIHEGRDNYSDKPPLGGGGARIACGIILRKDS